SGRLITDSGAFDACFHGESVDEETDEERVEAVERDWSHGGLLLKCCPDPTVLVSPGVALANRNRRRFGIRTRPLLGRQRLRRPPAPRRRFSLRAYSCRLGCSCVSVTMRLRLQTMTVATRLISSISSRTTAACAAMNMSPPAMSV